MGDHRATRRERVTVTIEFEPTTDCTLDSAVCTTWGKMLSNSASITITGP